VNENAKPLVSVVLPTYNGARYLRGSIESCLRQTHDNLELIIVDDASTDTTPDIIAEYAKADCRVKPVRHETNKRLPGGLNTGFAGSRGEYLTWTSDDNEYDADALSTMVEALQANQAAGMVYCDYRQIDEDGNELGLRRLPPPSTLVANNCIGACFLYRREVMEAIGEYAVDMFLVEDYEYWLRVSQQFSLVHLAAAPYRYRAHGGSLTATRQRDIGLQVARAKCKHIVAEANRRNFMAMAYVAAAWGAREAGQIRVARDLYLESMTKYEITLSACRGLLKCAVSALTAKACRAHAT
jgi:glycosyltransferase involved in cell wall biosynthesis